MAEPLFADEGDVGTARSGVTTSEVLVGAVGYDAKHISRREEMRMGVVLRNLGYIRKKVRIEGGFAWVYVPTDPTSPLT